MPRAHVEHFSARPLVKYCLWDDFQAVLGSNTGLGRRGDDFQAVIWSNSGLGRRGDYIQAVLGSNTSLKRAPKFSEAELALALCNCETGLVLTWLGVVLEATEAVHVAVEAFHGADLCLVWLAILLLLYSQERKKLARGTYGKK